MNDVQDIISFILVFFAFFCAIWYIWDEIFSEEESCETEEKQKRKMYAGTASAIFAIFIAAL